MALKHHWKFNNNLQDAVGDLHLTNVVGTPAYGNNKDNIANSTADCNGTWYVSTDALTTGIEEEQNISYSFWIKQGSASGYRWIYSGRSKPISNEGMFAIVNDTGIRVQLQTNTGREYWDYSGILDNNGEWQNIIITINISSQLIKIFNNRVLKKTQTTNGTSIVTTTQPIILFAATGGIGKMPIPIDEFKFFDTVLTDGGVTTAGQSASLDSEVWRLYISGVNNIPAYTLNPATEITGTSARLSWNES